MTRKQWDTLWEAFDEWYYRESSKDTCSRCGTRIDDAPLWDDQRKKIEELVNRRIRK